ATVEELKKGKGSPPAVNPDKAAKIKANLAKLSEGDRRLAEAQQYCAVEQDNPLGLMGVPVKRMIGDRPVFLCCPSCEDEVNAHPDKTLEAAEKLKARTKVETP